MKKLLSFLRSFSAFSGFFLFLAGCANFVLAYKAMQVGSRVVVTTNIVEMASFTTNSLPSVSSPVSFVSSNNLLPSFGRSPSPLADTNCCREVACYPYQYFLVGRRIGAEMFGRYYYDGSPCSYGRIDRIFPDRIILCSGDWISNKVVNDSRGVLR